MSIVRVERFNREGMIRLRLARTAMNTTYLWNLNDHALSLLTAIPADHNHAVDFLNHAIRHAAS